ncbi:YdcH family protein [Aurantimonas sp. HBX-1]|uniref:YdcH family protein n=1 Tax=Aurantimonas sp. HBX-1 TaxID=2906072 RepID=UPI001F19989F|nr:YdcH family protein [Aurantimonas sp. HBX-1]UIJ70879.1 YdcH family protein [Aurantimonas sp. HBX-1]
MSLDTHLATLEQRHTALDDEISAALVSKPAMTDAELAEMKRRKLKLKDEIERLRQPRN